MTLSEISDIYTYCISIQTITSGSPHLKQNIQKIQTAFVIYI